MIKFGFSNDLILPMAPSGTLHTLSGSNRPPALSAFCDGFNCIFINCLFNSSGMFITTLVG